MGPLKGLYRDREGKRERVREGKRLLCVLASVYKRLLIYLLVCAFVQPAFVFFVNMWKTIMDSSHCSLSLFFKTKSGERN